MLEKIKMWLRNNKSKIVGVSFVMIAIAFVISQFTIYQLREQNKVIFPKVENEINKLEPKVISVSVDKQLEKIEKNQDAKAKECKIVDGNIVLSENEFLKGRNLAIFDLNTFEYNENKYHLTTSSSTGAEIFGVRLKKINRDGTQTYITHYELVSNLQLNKKEYERYLLIKSKK